MRASIVVCCVVLSENMHSLMLAALFPYFIHPNVVSIGITQELFICEKYRLTYSLRSMNIRQHVESDMMDFSSLIACSLAHDHCI